MAAEDQEFDPYHVPQQRRRDKLRLSNLQAAGSFLPIYHSSSSDFLPDCLPPTTRCSMPASTGDGGGGCGPLVKEEFGGNFMCSSVGGGGVFSNFNLIYMDPRSSSTTTTTTTNPNSSFQENPFLYNPQNLRLLNACHNIHGLSLSLSTQQQQQQQQSSTSGSTLPLELNLQNYEHDSSIYSGKIGSFGGGLNELSRNLLVPLGPFTGYASVLKGSRFLKPAEQLLEEICEGIMYVDKMTSDDYQPGFLDQSTTMLVENVARNNVSHLGSEQGRNKSRLMSMLNEVYKRYKHYCHQMQAVVSSFESVAGVKNAAPFASMALKAMSKHFSCLRNAISDQLQFLSEPPHDNTGAHVAQDKDTSPPGFDTSAATAAATGMLDFVQHQPVWRPQRGLPERAVTILRAWLFDHFLHPYPTDTDKLMLAKQTGLSRNQVSNWFINARVRLWKPMVEEIHMLETRQAQKSSHEMADKEKDHLVPVSSVKIPSTSVQRIQDDISLKRARKETTATVMENAMDRNYMDELSSLPRLGSGGGSGGVSLTLGLEQNNGVTRQLADPFSLSAARRLGLVDPNGEEYHVGGGGRGWH